MLLENPPFFAITPIGPPIRTKIIHAKGIENFCLIHDSFGVLAPDYDIMAASIREAFCEIYEKDVLANWAKEMYEMLSEKNQRKFPKLPSKGKLDLALVKKSVLFCI